MDDVNEPTRVGVVGAGGRMGTAVCQAVTAAPDMTVAAALDLGDPLSGLADARCDVVVDFTHPDAVMDHVRFAAEAGIACVVGTSGFGTDKLAEARSIADAHPGWGLVVVPNFALGAVLALKFARTAARYFESAEVLELHHAGKADAPSGTALAAAAAVAEGRRAAGLGAMPDATTQDPDGARGAVVDGVHTHAVRMPGLVAHLEVLFGGVGEVFTIRHDSLSRESFMPGVLTAVRAVRSRPGLTVGLEPLLDD